jgi:hypothetical protein
MKMKATYSSETSLDIQMTKWHYDLEDETLFWLSNFRKMGITYFSYPLATVDVLKRIRKILFQLFIVIVS